MPTPRTDYRLYPSLLDSFTDLVNAESDWGQLWGNSQVPSKTAEEYALECEKRLIDQINRCPKEPNEAADKGTCFNAVVDSLIHGNNSVDDKVSIGYVQINGTWAIMASMNSFSFLFDKGLCMYLATRFKGALSQYLCEAPLQTSKGVVLLYGYLDEWVGCRISDIKTTGDYKFGKYGRKWQRHVYPYAVVESGECTEIAEFEYTAVELSAPSAKRPIITGEVFPEVYTYDHEQSRAALRAVCESFIEWLEYRRHLITDQRIFGGENPHGYAGVPVDINLLK